MHNIKNSHQIDNNNQQLTIVSIHAKIEIRLIISNITIIYIIRVSMMVSLHSLGYYINLRRQFKLKDEKENSFSKFLVEL